MLHNLHLHLAQKWYFCQYWEFPFKVIVTQWAQMLFEDVFFGTSFEDEPEDLILLTLMTCLRRPFQDLQDGS